VRTLSQWASAGVGSSRLDPLVQPLPQSNGMGFRPLVHLETTLMVWCVDLELMCVSVGRNFKTTDFV
jgi:hypothetical protein